MGEIGSEMAARGGTAYRVGHGFDLHRLEPRAPGGTGRFLVVGGVPLEHDKGPVSHSDGDALCHAVTDAILGAAGLPDIGQQFPDSDPRWESADSLELLGRAAASVRRAGWEIVNVDATVVLERPKLAAHKSQMAANLARAMGVDSARVNVKGKTHERVDAVGEGRAIEVHAVALIQRTGG